MCGTCESAFFTDPNAHEEYPSTAAQLDNPEFQLLLYHYVELVSGVEWKIPLLERLPVERLRSVLELGCNVGVTLDYCRTMWGAEVVGLEPSAYGLGGQRLLEIPIIDKKLEEASELTGFDLVFATEVIEHVHDPRALLDEIRRRMNSDGILLLTAPRAEHVQRSARPGELYATISAGAHRFIPSRQALERMVRDAGFGEQEWTVTGNSQVLYASQRPFALAEPPAVRQLQHRYYTTRRRRPTPDPRIRLAFAIHAEESGSREIAVTDELLRACFAISASEPDEIVRRAEQARDLFTFGTALPYGLPLALHARATKTLGVERSELAALSALVCAHGLRAEFKNLYPYHEILERSLALVYQAFKARNVSRAALRLARRALEVRGDIRELATVRARFISRAARWLA